MGHDAGANRIQLDVPVAGKHIPRGLDNARAIATFPQCSGSPMTSVEIPDVAQSEISDEVPTAAGALGRQEKMNVISHEAVRMYRAAVPGGELA
jgi:hypothetical protein